MLDILIKGISLFYNAHIKKKVTLFKYEKREFEVPVIEYKKEMPIVCFKFFGTVFFF